jgi:Ca2+-binding RTX toxin-like protein
MNKGVEVTREYVFGNVNPSSDYNEHIRELGDANNSVSYSAYSYMTEGAGRFAYPSTIAAIDAFFRNTTLSAGSYTSGQLSGALGLSNITDLTFQDNFDDFQTTISQYGTGIISSNSFDYAERAFIDGSTRFGIKDKSSIRFNIDANGYKSITGLEILPKNDLFKFDSGNPIAQIAGIGFFKPDLDPYNLVRGDLRINYTGSGREYQTYTKDNWIEDEFSRESDVSIPSERNSIYNDLLGTITLANWGANGGAAYYQELLNDEFLSYVKDGKKVVYGTSDGEILRWDDARGARIGGSRVTDGYYLVGGGGADTIVGSTKSDTLLGGDGNDTLRDSSGNDEFIGGKGNDLIEASSLAFGAGSGIDTAIYEGLVEDYEVTPIENGIEVRDRVADRDGTDTLIGIDQLQFADERIDFRVGQDIAFVVDTTGSMYDDLAAMQSRATEIVNAIFEGESGSPNSRVAVVGYNDPYTETFLSFTEQPNVEDRKTAAINAINSLYASGGGDFPESVNAGLIRALDGRAGQWRADATARRIILFGDAPPNDTELRAQVLALAANVGVSASLRAGLEAAPLSIVGDITTSAVANNLTVTRFALVTDANSAGATTIPVEIFTVLIGSDPTTAADFESLSLGTGGEFLNAAGASDLVDLILSSIETPIEEPVDLNNGTPDKDDFKGTNQDDTFYSLAGDDKLKGEDGSDLLDGGIGDDDIKGGQGNDSLLGGGGNDKLKGDDGDDSVEGGSGNDDLKGGQGNDSLFGDDGNDTLKGEDGNDRIEGGTGDDDLKGGQGSDTLFGNDGKDNLGGEDGDDLLDGGLGDDNLDGGKGNDFLSGGDGNDQLRGNDGSDALVGGNGNDDIRGGNNGDVLLGDMGNDFLRGESGDDILKGGMGNDNLEGGEGIDTFVLMSGGNADIFRDFKPRTDLLGLSGGIRFGQLSIVSQGKDTLIRIQNTGEQLAVLSNVSSNSIREADFVVSPI